MIIYTPRHRQWYRNIYGRFRAFRPMEVKIKFSKKTNRRGKSEGKIEFSGKQIFDSFCPPSPTLALSTHFKTSLFFHWNSHVFFEADVEQSRSKSLHVSSIHFLKERGQKIFVEVKKKRTVKIVKFNKLRA